MNSDLFLSEGHELEDLAHKHHTTVARVKQIIRENASSSREQIEAVLAMRAEPWWLPVKPVPKAG